MGRNDAGRHRAAEAERIADGEHPIADAGILGRELDERKRFALGIDLDQRHIGARVGADELGRIFVAAFERHRDVLGVLDHVVVGHDQAVRRDEEARPLRQARGRLGRGLRHAFAELLEEVVERVVLRKVGHARNLHVVVGDLDVALDVDAHHGRAHLGDKVGEAQRRAAIRRFDGRLGSGLGGGKGHAIAERQP